MESEIKLIKRTLLFMFMVVLAIVISSIFGTPIMSYLGY
jgi:hypothetical protein